MRSFKINGQQHHSRNTTINHNQDKLEPIEIFEVYKEGKLSQGMNDNSQKELYAPILKEVMKDKTLDESDLERIWNTIFSLEDITIETEDVERFLVGMDVF